MDRRAAGSGGGAERAPRGDDLPAGRRGLVSAGAISSATSAAALADIARSPIVPGANDNLTAVAVLVALAERLRERPVPGIRVLLVSIGAEEVCQGGIYGFGERHFPELDRERTWFLNEETVGSLNLVLMEGEGTVVMEDYRDKPFRDLVAQVAERAGVSLRRGMRWRNSTDSVIPNRAGFRIATLASMNRYNAMSNYHLMRVKVNRWIRTRGIADGVIDFERAIRDPDSPSRMLPRYDSGDGLHPNARGYRRMGAAVPLGLL